MYSSSPCAPEKQTHKSGKTKRKSAWRRLGAHKNSRYAYYERGSERVPEWQRTLCTPLGPEKCWMKRETTLMALNCFSFPLHIVSNGLRLWYFVSSPVLLCTILFNRCAVCALVLLFFSLSALYLARRICSVCFVVFLLFFVALFSFHAFFMLLEWFHLTRDVCLRLKKSSPTSRTAKTIANLGATLAHHEDVEQ